MYLCVQLVFQYSLHIRHGPISFLFQSFVSQIIWKRILILTLNPKKQYILYLLSTFLIKGFWNYHKKQHIHIISSNGVCRIHDEFLTRICNGTYSHFLEIGPCLSIVYWSRAKQTLSTNIGFTASLHTNCIQMLRCWCPDMSGTQVKGLMSDEFLSSFLSIFTNIYRS